MKLTADTITRIATDVAEANSFPVKVLGSVSAGGSGYVEILLQVEDGDAIVLMQLGVFRDAGIPDLRKHIAEQLRLRVSRRAS